MRDARQAAAPVAKSIGGFSDSEKKIIRDSVDFTREQAAGGRFGLFSGQADASEVVANYLENPLPKQSPHDIVGIGFALEPTIKSSQVGFDVVQAYQALTDAEIEFSTSERQTLLKSEAAELMEIEHHDVGIHEGDVVLQAGANEGAIRLPDPIRLESREIFDLELETTLTGQLPSVSDYNNVSGGVAQLVGFMEVVVV